MPATARGTRPGRRLRATGWAACRAADYPEVITGPEMSMATRDTHPAVMADSGSLLPGWALAPVSLLPRQPACRLQGGGPAGEHGRAQPCWICSLWRTLNGPDRAAARHVLSHASQTGHNLHAHGSAGEAPAGVRTGTGCMPAKGENFQYSCDASPRVYRVLVAAAGLAWGDVPTWVGSIGTVAAFSVAAGVYAQAQYDRRRAQAAKVTAWLSEGPAFFEPGPGDELERELIPVGQPELDVSSKRVWIAFSIRNGSDDLISDVIATLIMLPGSSLPAGSFWDGIETRFGEIPPGFTRWRAEFKDTGIEGNGFVRLQFSDTKGQRWVREGGRLRRFRRPLAEPIAARPLGVREEQFLTDHARLAGQALLLRETGAASGRARRGEDSSRPR